MSAKDFWEWQRDFYNTKPVFFVEAYDREEGWIRTNYYETEAGAEMEIAWNKKQLGSDRMRLGQVRLHTDDLARRRWCEE